MPAPTSYSEHWLAEYLLSANVLGPTATALGWTEPDVLEAVWQTLLAYGVSTIAEATDIPKLRALAKIEAWRQAANATAGHYRFSTDNQTLDRQQVHEHAVKMLAESERQAASYGLPGSRVQISNIRRRHDPYPYLPEEWRTLP
jgi:hypothetical protein